MEGRGSTTDAERKPASRAKLRAVPARAAVEISVLGTFGVRLATGPAGELAVGSQRLLAFLALHDRAVARTTISATMWPEASGSHSGDSLRAALSRLEGPLRSAVVASPTGLRLADSVTVDYREAQALARRLLRSEEPAEGPDLDPAALALLSTELLPDWYDDWVVGKAEDWRQLRLSALEAQASALADAGLLARAAEAARAAIEVDPLRETAHAVLIRIHLKGGNQSEALRAFEQYADLLRADLGLQPTGLITDLVRGIRNRPHAT